MTGFPTGISSVLRKLAIVFVILTGFNWPAVTAADTSSEVEMSGFVIVQETKNGRWEIQARSASYVEERKVLLKGVSAMMISNGEDRISVVSETGRFESDRLVLYLEGNVVIRSYWGSSLQAPVVTWNGTDDYIEASGGVTFHRGSIMVYGRSARYTIDSGMALIQGKVKATLGTEMYRQ